MKSFTDITQSKELAKILPIESADLWWAERYEGKVMENGRYIVAEKPVYYQSFPKPSEYNYSQDIIKDIPCWSLSALLNVLPKSVRLIGTPKDSYWYCEAVNANDQWYAGWESADNPIDACYNLIIRLNKLKML